jgi:hypothetical protein
MFPILIITYISFDNIYKRILDHMLMWISCPDFFWERFRNESRYYPEVQKDKNHKPDRKLIENNMHKNNTKKLNNRKKVGLRLDATTEC